MTDSILDSVKKVLGIEADYTAFDTDVIMHTNTALSVLQQLGIGPVEGFMIESNAETWTQFVGTDPRMNAVKTYVYMRVRLLFDPPSTSFAVASFEKQVEELGWRLNVTREGDEHPLPEPVPEEAG